MTQEESPEVFLKISRLLDRVFDLVSEVGSEVRSPALAEALNELDTAAQQVQEEL